MKYDDLEVWRKGKWSLVRTAGGVYFAVGSWWERVLVTRKETPGGPVVLFQAPVPAYVRRAAERVMKGGGEDIAA